jgi:hypothetical protein
MAESNCVCQAGRRHCARQWLQGIRHQTGMWIARAWDAAPTDLFSNGVTFAVAQQLLKAHQHTSRRHTKLSCHTKSSLAPSYLTYVTTAASPAQVSVGTVHAATCAAAGNSQQATAAALAASVLQASQAPKDQHLLLHACACLDLEATAQCAHQVCYVTCYNCYFDVLDGWHIGDLGKLCVT